MRFGQRGDAVHDPLRRHFVARLADAGIVVVAGGNGVIGRDRGLPWHMSSDLKTFRRLTMGKPMIMGRRTFDSIGKPLDGRDTIVLTRDAAFSVPGVSACDSIDDAITLGRVLATTGGADEIMVIGGAAIYDAVLARADRVYLTRVHGAPEGDRYFADLDTRDWAEVSREAIAKGPRDDFAATLIVYDRTAAAG